MTRSTIRQPTTHLSIYVQQTKKCSSTTRTEACVRSALRQKEKTLPFQKVMKSADTVAS